MFIAERLSRWRGLPLVSLLEVRTPLQHLERLSGALGADVFIKRDDIGSLGLGGNKARKLEFLLAPALEDGVDAIVTVGASQSNSARAVAAAAAALGTDCHLVLSGADSVSVDGNLLLDVLFGAHLPFPGAADIATLDRRAAELSAQLEANGRRVLNIPLGCSAPRGVLGFAKAYGELVEQLQELGVGANAIYHASGSGGMHAGLALGRSFCPDGPPVIGIDVGAVSGNVERRTRELAWAGAPLIDEAPQVLAGDIRLDLGHAGPGYGVASDAVLDAIPTLARLEGILTDPVYSGNALDAMIGHVRAGVVNGPVVYWHTGGLPACFSADHSATLSAAVRHGPGRKPTDVLQQLPTP